MPLCHWPCSCYPNHSLGQVTDWMSELYPRWVAAHGIMIVTPVYWYQAPSVLKLMIDRLVCADGGNPDPSTTHGKKAREAKAIELKGWDYPRHLGGRSYSVVVHGDSAGTENPSRLPRQHDSRRRHRSSPPARIAADVDSSRCRANPRNVERHRGSGRRCRINVSSVRDQGHLG